MSHQSQRALLWGGALLCACSATSAPDSGPKKGVGEACEVSTECAAELLCRDGECADQSCQRAGDCSGVPADGCAFWACVAGSCVSSCLFLDGGPREDAGVATFDFGTQDGGGRDGLVADRVLDAGSDAGSDGGDPGDTGLRADSGSDAGAVDLGPVDGGAGCPGAPRAPGLNDLLVNELLADPAAGNPGDANNDGVRDGFDDEFIELANVSTSPLLLTGVVVSDAAGLKHTFAPMILGCNQVVAIFGGGTDSLPSWGSNWVLASSGSLSLNNTNETITVGSSAGTPADILTLSYTTEADIDQSLVRQIELSLAAPLIPHDTHPSAGAALFSPGRRADGTAF